jgi:hypothetical protein
VWIGAGCFAAVALVVGVVLAGRSDPVGTEASPSEAAAWVETHRGAPSVAVTSTGHLLSITLDQVRHRVLLDSCRRDCTGANRRTTMAADLHGPGSGAAVVIGADELPRMSWTDASGPHLLVCSQSDCLPGSFL